MGRKGKNWRPPPPSHGAQPRDPEAPISNREARKVEARRQREELRRKEARRRRTTRLVGIVGGLVVVAGVVVAIVIASGSGGGSTTTAGNDPADLPGIQTGNEPWAPELNHLAARIRADGLPSLGAEQLQFHIHQHLDVFVNGQAVTVPQLIGISGPGSLAVIHTHDDSGVIHVESPIQRIYTLGNVFDVWGVLLTRDCIGGYCAKGDSSLRVFVDGKPLQGNPRGLILTDRQEIVVAFGTKDELPQPIPSTCTSSSCQSVGFGVSSPTPPGTASPTPSGSASPTASGSGSPSASSSTPPSSASPSASPTG
jgi:hypothetical protein